MVNGESLEGAASVQKAGKGYRSYLDGEISNQRGRGCWMPLYPDSAFDLSGREVRLLV